MPGKQFMSDCWSGRDDGPGREHARWHKRVRSISDPADKQGAVDHIGLIGFCSDEGVRRNAGRTGAAEGPPAIRRALSSLALREPFASRQIQICDYGDVTYSASQLESGQQAVSELITRSLNSPASQLTIVLGGGHETAWASYKGISNSVLQAPRADGSQPKLGVLNLDAHFDLRNDELPSSGTPFLQMAQAEEAAGRGLSYAVLGIAESSNTEVLFNEARRIGARWLTDFECAEVGIKGVRDFVEDFVKNLDTLYLSVDLDLLPASVAPGVSAPATLGVATPLVLAAVRAAAETGKLRIMDVVELAPKLDCDNRTAKIAGRIIDEAVGAAF